MTLINVLNELLEKPFKYSIHRNVNTMLTYSEIQHLESLYPVLVGVEEIMADCMKFPDTVEEFMEQYKVTDHEQVYTNGAELVPIFRMKQWFEHQSSVNVALTEPQEIGYGQCANAMLKMWIDNVVTDGEYNRIMDKLNKHYGKVEEKLQ